MKKALMKDALREIKGSLGRFLSIFAIVALGCGFFAGIKATKPDMVDTASAYFAENRLMDMKLVSTIGVRSSDVEAVKKADHVLGASAAYSKDVFYFHENQNLVLKCISFNDTLTEESPNLMNELVLLEGELPDEPGECAVEVKMSSPDTFVIGGELTFTEPDKDKELSETLAHDTYKIVGIVTSPMYIGYERDATTVGNGTIVSNVFLREEEFAADYYTEMFVRLEGVEEMEPFSDEYRDAVEELGAPARQAFEDSVFGRFDSIKADAQKKIDSAQESAGKLGEYLTMTPEELTAAREELMLAYRQAKARYDSASEGSSVQLLARSGMIQAEQAMGMLDELMNDPDEAAHEKYQAQLDDANAQIAAATEELESVRDAAVYTYDRFSASDDYSSFENDSDRIDSIAKVFPVFFIIVAALVCLTTMTRMVEEHRQQIGIYKALGYSSGSIAGKYLFYTLTAAALGSVLGAMAGLKIFPYIIYDSYKIMYNIPVLETKLRTGYILGCLGVSVVCVGGVVIFSCIKELQAEPSTLMRPKPPKSGKRVLLERVEPVWSRMSFLSKVTVRNLLRYKKRFFMTVLGVMGCTALIITGFGLKNSIRSIADRQFSEVFVYDGIVVLNTSYTGEELEDALAGTDQVDTFMSGQLTEVTASAEDASQNANIFVASRPEDMEDFVQLRDAKNGEPLTLGREVIVTQKLSMLLDLTPGDKVTVTMGEETAEFTVGAVSRNYAMHYIYMTPETYVTAFGKEPENNIAFVDLKEGTAFNSFKEELIGRDEFYGLTYKSDSSKGFLNSVDSLDKVVILLIVCAGLLAFVVLYNLANINITERVREIATVKVLGFYDGETSDYILRENYISAALGILLGCLAGKALHRFVVLTAEIDLVMFNRQLIWWAYLFGGLMTLAFTAMVNLILHVKLRGVDMVESLKSVE